MNKGGNKELMKNDWNSSSLSCHHFVHFYKDAFRVHETATHVYGAWSSLWKSDRLWWRLVSIWAPQSSAVEQLEENRALCLLNPFTILKLWNLTFPVSADAWTELFWPATSISSSFLLDVDENRERKCSWGLPYSLFTVHEPHSHYLHTCKECKFTAKQIKKW